MEQAASDFIREQLQDSRAMAQNSVELAQAGASHNTVDFLSTYAISTVTSINAFLGGVAGGLYDGFLTVAQVGRAIYNNPDLILGLSTRIMDTLTAGPGATVEAVDRAFQTRRACSL